MVYAYYHCRSGTKRVGSGYEHTLYAIQKAVPGKKLQEEYERVRDTNIVLAKIGVTGGVATLQDPCLTLSIAKEQKEHLALVRVFKQPHLLWTPHRVWWSAVRI